MLKIAIFDTGAAAIQTKARNRRKPQPAREGPRYEGNANAAETSHCAKY